MTPALHVTIAGRPAPQGSKRLLGHGAIVESSPRVAPWRVDVRAATEVALDATPDWPRPCTAPVTAAIAFAFPRPRSHYRTGRHAAELRPDAPGFVTSRGAGDLSKLIRALEDALVSAGALADDSLIVAVFAAKRYADTARATVILRTATP